MDKFLSPSIQCLSFNRVFLLESKHLQLEREHPCFQKSQTSAPVVLEIPVLSLWPYLLLCNVGLGVWSLQNLSASGANSLVPCSLLTCLNYFL